MSSTAASIRSPDDNRASAPSLVGTGHAVTRLVLDVLPSRRYASIARATGVLENVKQEFYRRYAAPYEDEQRERSGDVYP